MLLLPVDYAKARTVCRGIGVNTEVTENDSVKSPC
jgi:hypothetical protein